MADLENLLLEAAGRTGGSGRNRHSAPPSRRRHGRTSYSDDDGSDSKDYGDDSDDARGYGGRKPSGSQVPLKKRSKDQRDDDEEEDEEEEKSIRDRDGDSGDDDSDVGSDLYKGEDDRQQLAQMTELQREMILSDRATRIDDKKLHERVKSRWKNEEKKKPQPQPKRDRERERETTPPITTTTTSRAVRSSARSADRAAHKNDALNELRAKRLKQQGSEAASSRGGGGGGGGGLGGPRGSYSPVKRNAFTAAGLSSSSSQSDSEESGSQSHSEEDDRRRLGIGRRGGTRRMDHSDDDDDDDDDERSKPQSHIPTFEEIKGITIRRSKLAKWFMEPFFDELIVGCFVRVGIGTKSGMNVYRLCIVRNVDASDPDRQYKLDNKITYKYLNCVWGSESSAARWQMARISDSPPDQEEYRQWVREVERRNGRIPSKQEVAEKREAIEKTNNFVYSAETVKQMLQEKKSASTKPLNIAAEKEKLRRELEAAEFKNDVTQVERIKARLQELEAMRQAQAQGRDSKALRLAEMNRKNRVENFRNASELKPVNTSLKAGEAGYDPFSRRWTKSKNYYEANPENKDLDLAVGNGDNNNNNNNNNTEEEDTAPLFPGGAADNKGQGARGGGGGGGSGRKGGVEATAAALKAAAGAGKLVDTSAPMDQGTESNMLHNFDLPISLAALKRFGGPKGAMAAFMARKQNIEATIGYRVPENDGRRHPLVLSVSDYKRRMGLS
ncbi:hypothetical protein Dimus_032769 [Dionaea muscipula]